MAATSVEPAVTGRPGREGRPAVSGRLVVPMPGDRIGSWLWAVGVAALAGVLRFVGLGSPPDRIFDEVYYAHDAYNLLRHGVELNSNNTGPGFVVHPPLGKWLIALGEWAFGLNSYGWRFSAAVVGSLSVLLLVRVGRRMFRSTAPGCTAGLLLSLDGLEFVQSRVAMLDIFLMWWVLAGFACLLVDRDDLRRRLAAAGDVSAGAGRLGVRWWRYAGALCLAIGVATKWSAIWYVIALGLLSFAWDCGARRTAGVARPVRDTLRVELPGYVACGVGVLVVYVASFTGWFLSSEGWDRHWAEQTGHTVPLVPSALVNLLHYQQQVWHFHDTLDASHPYASQPWGWLLLARPVAYYYSSAHTCGAASCAREVLAIGTPPLWWGFLVALVAAGWRWLARRDWRGAAVLAGAGAGILPWLPFPTRTMFLFYTMPALPFLVLATTLTLAMAIGPRDASPERRAAGIAGAAAYVLVVALAFFYFYPLLAGLSLPYEAWHHRIWFPSWI